MLIMSISAFTIQPEEHTGKKGIFQLKRACLQLLWGKQVYLVKFVVFKEQGGTDAFSCPAPLLHGACSGYQLFLPKSEPRKWCFALKK